MKKIRFNQIGIALGIFHFLLGSLSMAAELPCKTVNGVRQQALGPTMRTFLPKSKEKADQSQQKKTGEEFWEDKRIDTPASTNNENSNYYPEQPMYQTYPQQYEGYDASYGESRNGYSQYQNQQTYQFQRM